MWFYARTPMCVAISFPSRIHDKDASKYNRNHYEDYTFVQCSLIQ